jgi:hypothetical protein
MTKDEALLLASVVLDHCYGHHAVNDDMIEQTAKVIQATLEAKDDPVKLRRGDILRCIETDELCTVWATSTSGKTLVKWGGNDFTDYTAEQIGELFWLEPTAKDEPVAYINVEQRKLEWAKYMSWDTPTVVNLPKIPLYTTPPQRKPLTDEEILTYRHMIDWTAEWSYINFARAIEVAHGIKGEA